MLARVLVAAPCAPDPLLSCALVAPLLACLLTCTVHTHMHACASLGYKLHAPCAPLVPSPLPAGPKELLLKKALEGDVFAMGEDEKKKIAEVYKSPVFKVCGADRSFVAQAGVCVGGGGGQRDERARSVGPLGSGPCCTGWCVCVCVKGGGSLAGGHMACGAVISPPKLVGAW